MIDKALNFLVNELNEYLDLKIGEKPVELTNLGDDTSGVSPVGKENVGCSIVNIEEDRVAMKHVPYSEPVGGVVSRRNPEIYLNLFLVFAVNPDKSNYSDAMKLLSMVITFFQGKHEFNSNNSPSLDPELNHLSVDLYSLPIEQQNYLWSGIGAKYLPSVIYRVRLVKILDDRVLGSGPGIESIDVQPQHKSL